MQPVSNKMPKHAHPVSGQDSERTGPRTQMRLTEFARGKLGRKRGEKRNSMEGQGIEKTVESFQKPYLKAERKMRKEVGASNYK
jgi:hypothetical protein